MKIIDITIPISPQMPVWPGDPPVILEKVSSMDAGAHVNVSRLECSVHTGTHVDAPHHFLNDGRTVESLLLEVMIGKALIIHIPEDVGLITAAILEQAAIPDGTERLLLRTQNSTIWQHKDNEFHRDFVAISPDGAEWLVQHGLRLVGIDYLSIAPYKKSIPTHVCLLRAGLVLLEGLDLSEVEPGWYDLYCLPLKLAGSDGSPARAVLVK